LTTRFLGEDNAASHSEKSYDFSARPRRVINRGRLLEVPKYDWIEANAGSRYLSSWGDETAIEIIPARVQGWDIGVRRLMYKLSADVYGEI
jgi:hypothetical protein